MTKKNFQLSLMVNHFIFSSESVGEGHPDKVADYIADSILDVCLQKDPNSRVACEVLVKSNCVFLAGEISTHAHIDYDYVVRDAIREIGYTNEDDVFHADRVFITNAITSQSPEIARGVDKESVGEEQGAGDQGIMFGFACNDTEEMMPAPIMFAHRINRELARLRRSSAKWLRPDCKSQVAVEYRDGQPIRIVNVVISVQHTPEVSKEKLKDFCIKKVIQSVIPENLLDSETEYFINPSGDFLHGGPQVDAGLTGRKVVVDTYGGWSRHGGGGFSGKDPSKVDRSGAYMSRWVAKNVVAAGLADEVELQVAYAIGYHLPTSIHLSTFGTGKYPDEEIIRAVKEVFSFKPADIINQLDLKRPIYTETTHYGHFTKEHLPWEQLNRVNELQEAISKSSLKTTVR